MNPLAQWFHRNAQMTTARPAGRRPATTRRQSLRFKPRVNALEDRCLLSVESIDGTGNNLTNPDWGSAGTDLIRMSPVGYADGIITSARKLLTNRSYGVSYHLCSG